MASQRGQIKELIPGKKYRVRFYAGKIGAKRHYPSEIVYGTRRDASKILTAMLAKHDEGKLSIRPESKLPLADILKKYLVFRQSEVDKGKLSADYLKCVNDSFTNHIVPFFGNEPISKIDFAELQRFVNTLEMKLAPSSIQAIYAHLKGVLKFAFTEGYIKELVASPRLPAKSVGKKKVFSWEEIRLILGATEKRFKAVFLMLACSGIRPSELIRIKWDDIDLANRVLYIRKSKTDSGMRAILLPHIMIEELVKLERAGKLVFHDGFGEPLTNSKIYNAFQRSLKVLGLKGNPYQLRHSHTTRNLEVPNISDKVISDRQGHSDERFTRSVYMHPEVQMQEPIAALWDKKLRSENSSN